MSELKPEEPATIRMLLVGPLPPPDGGCTVLFDSLVRHLDARTDVELYVADTTFRGGGLPEVLLHVWEVIWRVVSHLHKVDVLSLHTTNTKLLPSLVPLVFLSAISCRPLVVRKFGGLDHRRSIRHPHRTAGFRAWLSTRLLARSALYLAETRKSVGIARRCGIASAQWFPNSRDVTSSEPVRRTKCRRFVFIGLVCETKGVKVLAKVARNLTHEDVVIDIYGPLGEGVAPGDLEGLPNLRYRGAVEPDRVPALLREYDCLVLPTFHEGEGYPGVILEAYSEGLPVVVTRWLFIPEIVDERSGILVEPRSEPDLQDAMTRLMEQDETFASLCEGARAKAEDFSASRWADYFVECCRAVARRPSHGTRTGT